MIAFLAVMVFLIGYQFVLKKYGPPPQQPTTQQPAPVQQQQAQTPAPPAPPVASAASGKKSKAAPVAATKQASAESETVIENDLYKITFTNRGGQVKSWVLKQFDDDDGRPLDLVNQAAAQQYGYPLSLFTYDENLRKKLAAALYVVSEDGTAPLKPTENDRALTSSSTSRRTITFEYADADTTVRKSFSCDGSYLVRIDTLVTQNGNVVTALPAWPAGFGDGASPGSPKSKTASTTTYGAQVIAYAPLHPGKKWWGGTKEVEREPFKNISGGNTIRDPFYFGGIADQYFGAVFLPDNPSNAIMVTLRNPLAFDATKIDILGAAVGDLGGHFSGRLFVGPKNIKLLDAIATEPVANLGEAPKLGALIDLGTFSIFVRPLFVWVRWTYQHVGNWGWAIIVVTVVINAALLPLRLSSMKSSLKTQKIQPQIKAIRDKYGKIPLRDPKRAEANQKMNTEIAALMKEHGVNPAGGCLPLIIQLPFLWAFYSMLGNLIELRHAHWLYIRDLSGADPWHILPVLIVITTFIVQRMTPQGGRDPQQQKMMNVMMPLMLGFISNNLSSGLCLYWVVGNLVAMLLQVALNRTDLGREQRELAAKRARKQALKA